MGDHLEITHRLSEGTKNLLRDLFGCNLEQKIDRLIELLEAGVNIPDLGFINAKLDLILGILEGESQEKINEAAAKLKAVREKMQQSIDKQGE